MDKPLIVTIPDKAAFYSLYSDGLLAWKHYDKDSETTSIAYNDNAVVILYYTYPTHREACIIRSTQEGGAAALPGLSKKVSLLFSVHASKVDKLRRAAGFLNKHHGGAFSKDDGFYLRLYFLLCEKGPLNYPALKNLAERSAGNNL
jgi:hypothetical protein